MNDEGFTIMEALVALTILGAALVGMIPSFQTFMDANSVSEERSNSVAAAQEVMEGLRQLDPASLPTSGTTALAVAVGAHEYETVTHYCTEPSYCNTTSRHIVLEVSFGGKKIYTVESVYTRLR